MTNVVRIENGSLTVFDEDGNELITVHPENLPDGLKHEAMMYGFAKILKESQNPHNVAERWSTGGSLLGASGRPADIPDAREIRQALELLGLPRSKQEELTNKWYSMTLDQKKLTLKNNKMLKKAIEAVRLQASGTNFSF